MTPYVLLLTSAEDVGGPLMVPIPSVDFMVPVGENVRIFLTSGQFLDVTESWDAIIRVMGGLVMQPNTTLGAAWKVQR